MVEAKAYFKSKPLTILVSGPPLKPPEPQQTATITLFILNHYYIALVSPALSLALFLALLTYVYAR